MLLEQDVIKRCWVEINLSQLRENYRIVKNLLSADAQIMGVVKADAYGHGDVVVARLLEEMGVRLFAVATLGEAIGLRQAGIGGEILILGYTPPELAEEIYTYNITQTLLSEEYAEALSCATTRRLKVQFAIDTGMNRIGLDGEEAEACAEAIRKYAKCFDMQGIFTHLCVADSTEEDDIIFTERQMELFAAVAERVDDLAMPYVHCLNSAGGIYHYEKARGLGLGGIVRLGIVLYGLHPDRSNPLPKGIAPALSWKTVVSIAKSIHAGETVGYGRTYTAEKDLRVATLPVGYADGYNRGLSGKGYVLIHGKRARILGRVCMDQMMVDVSEIPEVAPGDEVILLGQSGAERITADDMGAMLDTIGYEIVCDISKRVERLYLEK